MLKKWSPFNSALFFQMLVLDGKSIRFEPQIPFMLNPYNNSNKL